MRVKCLNAVRKKDVLGRAECVCCCSRISASSLERSADRCNVNMGSSSIGVPTLVVSKLLASGENEIGVDDPEACGLSVPLSWLTLFMILGV